MRPGEGDRGWVEKGDDPVEHGNLFRELHGGYQEWKVEDSDMNRFMEQGEDLFEELEVV